MAKQNESPKAPKVKRINRHEAANRTIADVTGKTSLSELAVKADALLVAAGGKSNVEAAAHFCKRALETAEAMGVVKLTRPTDLFVERLPVKK